MKKAEFLDYVDDMLDAISKITTFLSGFDFETFSPKKVGAIYIESYQSPIEIQLNDASFKDKSGLLKKGTLLSGIIPKKYQLSIQKEGFLEYQKNIEVFPSQVERFFNILLVPQSISYATTTITTTTNTQLIAINQTGAITKTIKGKTTLWNLISFSKPTEENISTTTTNLLKTIASFSKQKFSDFSFVHYSNQNELLATGTQGIYKVALDKKTATFVAPINPVLPYARYENSLLTITPTPATSTSPTKKTTLKKPDPKTTNATIISYAIDSGASTTISFLTPRMLADISFISLQGQYIIYGTTDKKLWFYDIKKQTEQQIAPDGVFALFSPDSKKLLYRESSGKTHIYFIEDELETANARAGDDITLSLINASAIRNIYWYQDSAHILALYPTRITLAETTKTEPNNQFTLYEGAYAQSIYTKETNTLLIARTHTELLKLDITTFTQQ
jgi:hypothetical protein